MSAVRAPEGAQAVVFFDGDCGFCNRSVRFVHRRDARGGVYFSPLQGTLATHVLPEELRRVDALGTMVLWIPESVQGQEPLKSRPAGIYLRSEAALRIGLLLRSPWPFLSRIGLSVPLALRDGVYGWIARNRHRLVRQHAACAMPEPSLRARMVS